MSKGWIQWYTLVTLVLSGQKQIPEASLPILLSDFQASERLRLKRNYGEYLWEDAELSTTCTNNSTQSRPKDLKSESLGSGLGVGYVFTENVGDSVLLAPNSGPA